MYRMNLVNPVSSCNPVLISLRNQLRVSDKNTPNFLVDPNFPRLFSGLLLAKSDVANP